MRHMLSAMEEDLLGPRPRSGSKESDLPDLTDRLKAKGIYEEYVEWRNSYHRWRQGNPTGAKGENTVEAHLKRASKDFQHWYPTVSTFQFRRTLSFWSPVFCSEGCLLFLWVAYFDLGKSDNEYMEYILTKIPTFVGGTLFLVSIYAGYFELINVTSDIDSANLNYVWCDWAQLFNQGVDRSAVAGSLFYLVGAVFYSVAQVTDLCVPSETLDRYLVQWPLILGGFLFLLGGVCELVINKVFSSRPTSFVWWASLLNTVGGVLFWLTACPSVFAGDAATIGGAVGTAAYLIGASLSLCMWRGEQFGGAMIPALNVLSRDSAELIVRKDPVNGAFRIVPRFNSQSPYTSPIKNGGSHYEALEEVLNPKLSWRHIIFLNICFFIGSLQIVTACGCLDPGFDTFAKASRLRRIANVFLGCLGNIVAVHMILVLSSAGVSMPAKFDEPYYTLAIMMRIMSVVVMANSVLTLKVLFDADERVEWGYSLDR